MDASAAVAATRGLDAILGAVDAEQRAAATLPDGPAQIIAPAGSGKTTTMVARLAVLLARGVAPERICVVTFNRDAAQDLAARVERRLAPTVPAARHIEIRTLHALARQVALDAGERREIVADRLPLLRAARRRVTRADRPPPPEASELDTWLSAWRIEGRDPPERARAALDAYRDLLSARGLLDFDDLVVGATERLERDARLRLRWQARFAHVCVDEFQDVDAAQLRLVRLLAAPEDNLFVVGDDDQTIYAWRLADVRRILRFSSDYPAARRVMLATNYRCPVPVVAASARLVAVNVERFAKPIRAAPDRAVDARAIEAWPSGAAEWPDHAALMARGAARRGRQLCFLARTRTELVPVFLALVRAGVAHRPNVPPLVDAPPVTGLVDAARRAPPSAPPFRTLLQLRAGHGWRRGDAAADHLSDEDQAALDALLGWSVAFRRLGDVVAAFDAARARIHALQSDDANVELATVHAAKGREWETVVVVGFEDGRMPNRRSIEEAPDRGRAIEEERRLAYVALTRATGRLILAFDPARPSPFLAEMGLALGGGHQDAQSTMPMRRGPPGS
jgi:superfamily I DNA/RNA helicase